MTITDLLFFISAFMLISSSVMVVCARNAVRAVLFLVLAFFSCAVLWLLMQAEFLAVTLVLVYVGAVMVLFLFVVMMLDVDVNAMREKFARHLPVGLAVTLAVLVQMVLVLMRADDGLSMPVSPSVNEELSNISAIGQVLYTDYVYAFELAAVVLLVAIIAAITLTFRGRRQNTKSQTIAEQVAVKREDRVRLIQMKSEGDER